LHLGNIVLWQGEPTPFDAIEFDEKLAVIDTLYDLSFLLMDLDERGYRDAANAVLNRYLWLRNLASDLEALSALPLFLSLRAGVRAMVTAQRAALRPTAAAEVDIAAARRYFGASLGYLSPASACLVAIGGLSGTGKSTLAARLSPSIGAAPGSLHLRSDLERKSMFGVEETARLPAETYNAASSDAVYARIMEKAALALKAGHSVVVDAVFAKPAEKQQIETIAERCGVSFRGVWLSAPGSILKARVDARNNDASDATSHVVEQQLSWDSSPDGWAAVDASGPMDATFAMAISVLRLPQK
jgi:predicted kinase